MWEAYVGDTEVVAVKSTIGNLIKYVYVHPEYSQIGKVEYLDHYQDKINMNEASQAMEIAFLKDNAFAYENELRITTLNFNHTWVCKS